jgi:ubiquinone/menaquinone biosynthesis C-methylase UbiE
MHWNRIREHNCRLNDRFFATASPRYVDRFRELADLLSRNAETVLHVGASTIDLQAHLKSEAVKPRVINLDLDLGALRENLGGLKVCGNAEALPFQASSVDLICAEHTFEHFPRPLACLQECYRVLRGGGRLVVSGPNGRSYIALMARLSPLSFHKLVRTLAQGTIGPHMEAFPTFYRFSTPGTILRLVRKAGFDIVGFETFVGAPCYTTFLPFLHWLFIGLHLFLEKLRPRSNFHITSVGVFQKPCGERG